MNNNLTNLVYNACDTASSVLHLTKSHHASTAIETVRAFLAGEATAEDCRNAANCASAYASEAYCADHDATTAAELTARAAVAASQDDTYYVNEYIYYSATYSDAARCTDNEIRD